MTNKQTIAALRGQIAAMSSIMEAFPDKHMRWPVVRPDGTVQEATKCADGCYACRLDELEQRHNQAQLAASVLAAAPGNDHAAQLCGLVMEGKYDEVHNVLKRDVERRRKYLQQRHRTVVSVIAVEEGGKLDCCDEELFHVWVTVLTWSGRRAYCTGASPFITAVGETVIENVDDLKGTHFYADVPFEPPPAMPEPGEHLEWTNLELTPPTEEIERKLGLR